MFLTWGHFSFSSPNGAYLQSLQTQQSRDFSEGKENKIIVLNFAAKSPLKKGKGSDASSCGNPE